MAWQRWPALWVLSVACPVIVGQTDRPTTSDSQAHPATQATVEAYWVRVTADAVNLRSRPDVNSIPVAREEAGTVLRAVGQEYGWHRVVPPAGVFSYVSAAHVELKSETEGVVGVRSGALRVRVGSLVREVDPQHSEVQTLVERGTPVQIVGTQGEWLKIAPPPGVYVYVFGDHVERISDDLAARLRAAQVAVSQPIAAPTSRSATRPVVAAATRPAEGPDLSGPWGGRLLTVEAAITAEAQRLAVEQSWDDALARLRPIAAQREEPRVAALAAAWMQQLEERTADQHTIRAADEVLRRAARERAQHAREIERIERLRERGATQPALAARGALLRSFAVGERDGKRWYKLQDPLTRRVETYLEVEPESDLDPESYLGKYVGVRGERRLEPELGADVVRVEAIVSLAGEEPATQPAGREP